MGTVEMDDLNGFVGFIQSVLAGFTPGGDGENPSACRDQVLPFDGCTSVENINVGQGGDLIQSGDQFTRGIGAWITAGGHDHTGRVVIMPVDGDLRQLPFVDGLYDRDEITLETGQNDLAFRRWN